MEYPTELLEKLADLEHRRWSHWQEYLHGRLTNLNGTLVMSPKYRSHLERQINTPYSKLTEKEKDSDREEVKKFICCLEKDGYVLRRKI